MDAKQKEDRRNGAIGCLVVAALGLSWCGLCRSGSDRRPSVASVPTEAAKPVVIEPPDDRPPACNYLRPFGLPTGDFWQPDPESPYQCVSTYKKLPSSGPLENHMTYAVLGESGGIVHSMTLELDIYDRRTAEAAREALIVPASQLCSRVFGQMMPDSMFKAIRAGKPLLLETGAGKMSLERSNWPTGLGYDLKFSIEL